MHCTALSSTRSTWILLASSVVPVALVRDEPLPLLPFQGPGSTGLKIQICKSANQCSARTVGVSGRSLSEQRLSALT